MSALKWGGRKGVGEMRSLEILTYCVPEQWFVFPEMCL